MYKNKTLFKQVMSANFSAAADSYNKAANIQRKVASFLHEIIADNITSNELNTIIDLGSGTGRETYLLAKDYPSATIIGLDIATQMLNLAAKKINIKNIKWCQADVEQLPFSDNICDLVFSNLTLQWCDLTSTLASIYQILKPSGYLFFSTLCENSLEELANSWSTIQEDSRVNQYLSKDVIKQIIGQSAFSLISMNCKKHTLYYPDVISVLKNLKHQGSNTIYKTNGKLTAKNSLNQLIDSYEKLRTNQGIPLSYNIAYIALKKQKIC